MNIIVFGSGKVPRHLNLSASFIVVFLFACALIASAGAVSGYWLANRNLPVMPVAEIQHLRQSIVSQKSEVSEIRGQASKQLDALAIRVADLNANVIRLNALGRRLTGMANLESGEFDFDSAPALGGPEALAVSASSGQVVNLVADIDSLGSQLYDQEQQLTVLEGLLLNRKLHQRVYPRGRPVKAGWMSSGFGRRTDPFTGKAGQHRGVDFAGKAGSEIVAVGAGVVSWSGDRHGYGKMIEVNHGNGYVTRYAHNQENFVAVGDYVQQGQTIALMGSTGRATGPNLHFEVWHLGKPVNPVRHIRETS